MKTSGIRENDAKGRHTTTNRQMIELENGVVLIDTPGMRELGMCAVKEALDNGTLSWERYTLYKNLHSESSRAAKMKAISKYRKVINKNRL